MIVLFRMSRLTVCVTRRASTPAERPGEGGEGREAHW